MIYDRLQILDPTLWNLSALHILRLLHKYKGRDMAVFIDLFDKDIEDEFGEPLPMNKAPQ